MFSADRMDFGALAPRFYAAMVRLDHESRRAGPEPALLELVRYRASQLNGCAFCLDMHAKDARAAGECEERLYVLAAWRQAPFYSDRERAALALADAMTLLSGEGVPDDVYEQAAGEFSAEELAGLIATITVINAWNRIAVTTRMAPGHYQPQPHVTNAGTVPPSTVGPSPQP